MPNRAVLAFLLSGSLIWLTAQEPATDLTLRTTVQQVLLDFIVRDRGEKLVQNLRVEDVEVYENGVKQDVKSFRFVGGEAGRLEAKEAETGAEPGKSAQKLQELNLVCFVFGGLSPESRANAREAASYFLKNEMRRNTYAGIFALGSRLYALQQFTQDKEKIQAAINKAAGQQTSGFGQDSQQVAREAESLVSTLAASGTTPNASSNIRPVRSFSAGSAAGPSDPALAALLLEILIRQQAIVQNTVGTSNLVAMLDMMSALGKLPGRKTIVYLSQGLLLNPNQLQILRDAISVANQNNVSVYGVDVNGLTVQSGGGLQRALGTNAQPINSSNRAGEIETADGGSATDAADIVRDNIQENLRDLSESTGGFLIANTNEFGRAMTRIVEDVNTHYEVTYTPTATTLDGHFRKIEIKLKRRGWKVQSRSGYYALPNVPGRPTLSYEKDLLSALEAPARPRDFPFAARAFRFRSGPSTQLVTAFETAASNLRWDDAPNHQKSAHLSVVALVRDQNEQVVEKLSRDLPVLVRGDRAQDYGMFSISLNLTLAPGRYTVDWAAMDRNSGKTGTKRQLLVVPNLGGLTMSQPFVARRADPATSESGGEAGDPLRFMDQRLTPSVTGQVKSGAANVPVYFVLYPPVGAMLPGALQIEVLRDGKVVANARPPLPQPTADGALPFLAVIPAKSWEPGQYEIRITATQGELAAQEMVLVDVL